MSPRYGGVTSLTQSTPPESNASTLAVGSSIVGIEIESTFNDARSHQNGFFSSRRSRLNRHCAIRNGPLVTAAGGRVHAESVWRRPVEGSTASYCSTRGG